MTTRRNDTIAMLESDETSAEVVVEKPALFRDA
jgi:hypothetical protein